MKRFYVQALAGADTEIWLDSGFAAFAPGLTRDGMPRRPDVLLVPAEDWRPVAELWPKVVVVQGTATPPEDLAEEYKPHTWRGFTVLTRLEARLGTPAWDEYADEAKAVTGAVYRHLFEDVLRETREWCGHTFSVLGR